MDPFTMPESLDGLSATDLAGLRESALSEFAGIRDSAETPEALTPENLDRLEELAGFVGVIDTAVTTLAAATEAHAARATGLAAQFPPAAPVVEIPAVEPPAAPAAPAPVVAATAVVPAPRRPSAAAVVANAPAAVVPNRAAGLPIIAAASDMPSAGLGHVYPNLNDSALRQGLIRHLESMPRSGEGYAKGTSFSLTTEYPPELIASAPHDTEVLRRAVDQSRLAGGSIIAAGGWCAPCEQRYDVCTTASFWGGVSLPTVQVPRGCLNYFQNLDYQAVAAQIPLAAACYTAAQLEVDPPLVKPCFEIPCVDPVNLTLDVCSICVRVGILQQKAFPELVSAYLDQLLVAHAHFLNARDIAQLVALTPIVAVEPATFGAIAPFLDALDLQATNLRYREGRPLTYPVEIIAPAWLPGEFRSDYEKREITDSSGSAEIRAGLAERNISVQWVSDYQDAAFVAAAPGPLTWPTTADVIMYTAGTFVKGETGVIDVGPLYDSTLLSINRQQLLFSETASQIGRFCGTGLRVRIPLCPSGEVAGRVDPVGANACPTY